MIVRRGGIRVGGPTVVCPAATSAVLVGCAVPVRCAVAAAALGAIAVFAAPPAAGQQAAAADINRWLAHGRLRVPIDRVLPLAATAEGHALQESNTIARSGTLAGKIVIEP